MRDADAGDNCSLKKQVVKESRLNFGVFVQLFGSVPLIEPNYLY